MASSMLNLIPSILKEAMSARNRSSLEMAGFRERLGGVMP
jgi:hypothetical protein